MKSTKIFPFSKARRISSSEVSKHKKGIEKKLGIKRLTRGRPPKDSCDKFKSISIRLHPDILDWAKNEAHKRGVGYQTVINEELLKKVS